MRRALLSLVLLAWFSAVGFSLHGEDGKDKKPATNWLGTWQAAGKEDCKELRCAAKHLDGERWQATFTGVCSREFCFEVKMNGVRRGEKIVFEGKTDLGEQNGGVYRWSGEIEGEKFTGKYKSTAGKEGTFEMKPASATEGE